MDSKYYDNNKVFINGVVLTAPQYSHTINVTVSERLFVTYKPEVRDHVMINGQFRSYNNYSDVGSKLILTIFVKELVKVNASVKLQNPNNIYLNGFICKAPVYRMTPFKREVADIMLAVNRAYNHSDYIPCIAWGRNAKFSESLAVGTNICVWGRIQSRAYRKQTSEDKAEIKTAYEVSVSKMEIKKPLNVCKE